MMVGFCTQTSVRKGQSPGIRIDDVMHPAMGVGIILILGGGPNIPRLVPRNTIRRSSHLLFIPMGFWHDGHAHTKAK